jgi:hypothetical protein
VANCKPFQDEVHRLQQLLQEQDVECRGITDPTEARICRQIRAALASQLARAGSIPARSIRKSCK